VSARENFGVADNERVFASLRAEWGALGPVIQGCLRRTNVDCYGPRGELLEEYTPTGWLAHSYDDLGNRVNTTISGERTIDWLHYGSGHVHQVRVDDTMITDIERDDLHREVLRTQGRLTSEFGYDSVGRRAQHTALREERGCIRHRISVN
jgi:YD repeat-containing protein